MCVLQVGGYHLLILPLRLHSMLTVQCTPGSCAHNAHNFLTFAKVIYLLPLLAQPVVVAQGVQMFTMRKMCKTQGSYVALQSQNWKSNGKDGTLCMPVCQDRLAESRARGFHEKLQCKSAFYLSEAHTGHGREFRFGDGGASTGTAAPHGNAGGDDGKNGRAMWKQVEDAGWEV